MSTFADVVRNATLVILAVSLKDPGLHLFDIQDSSGRSVGVVLHGADDPRGAWLLGNGGNGDHVVAGFDSAAGLLAGMFDHLDTNATLVDSVGAMQMLALDS